MDRFEAEALIILLRQLERTLARMEHTQQEILRRLTPHYARSLHAHISVKYRS